MKKIIPLFMILILLLPIASAQLDAVFVVKNKQGRQLYMVDDKGDIIYGDVAVNQYVLFDATSSNDLYGGIKGIEEFWWDWNGDGKWDIKGYDTPYIWHSFDKPGIYNVTLMIVDKNAPGGPYSDVVRHPVKVVEKLLPPVVKLYIKKIVENGSVKCIFNASYSYDPNGYIKTFEWDLDGDGKYEERGASVVLHNYTSNGYYIIHLRLTNWDLLSNVTTRVIRIDELNGSLNSVNKSMTFINRGKARYVSVVINNDEKIRFRIEKKKTITLSLNNGLNEIDLKYDNVKKTIIFDVNESVSIYIGEKENHTPFIGIPFLFLVFLIITFRKRINSRPS